MPLTPGMSPEPENLRLEAASSQAIAPERSAGTIYVEGSETARRVRRRHRLWGFFFALLAFEIGLFLTIYPWLDSWNLNHFAMVNTNLQDLWDDPYFRGALSGLGIVNIFISIRQAIRLLNPASRP
jgi:hypothetical protein